MQDPVTLVAILHVCHVVPCSACSFTEEADDIEEHAEQSLVAAEQHDPGAATADITPELQKEQHTPSSQGSPHNRLTHSPQALDGHVQLEVHVEHGVEPHEVWDVVLAMFIVAVLCDSL